MVYLGGLGEPRSEHLRSRAETAQVLAAEGPALTYLRASMVIGAGERVLPDAPLPGERLPAMIAPAWLRNRTQPIAVRDVLQYLAQAGERRDAAGREVQVAGADVLTYGDLLDLMADVLGKRRRPRLPVPLLTPKLSSHWIGLVTPVDAGVARPLIESLASETVVTDPAAASLFDVRPIGSAEALRRARAEELGRGRAMLSYEARSTASTAAAWALLARPARWTEWAPHVRGAWRLGRPEVREGALGFARLSAPCPFRRGSRPRSLAAPGPGAWPAYAWSTGSSLAGEAAPWRWIYTPRHRWRPP